MRNYEYNYEYNCAYVRLSDIRHIIQDYDVK